MNALTTERSDELIESFLNGNIDFIKSEWNKMNYIDKDKFIDDIFSCVIEDESKKLKLLAVLLRATF